MDFNKNIERITARFYWYKQIVQTREYVRTCQVCQQIKSPSRYNQGPLESILPTRPNELLTTDIMGPMPQTSRKNRYVLVDTVLYAVCVIYRMHSTSVCLYV